MQQGYPAKRHHSGNKENGSIGKPVHQKPGSQWEEKPAQAARYTGQAGDSSYGWLWNEIGDSRKHIGGKEVMSEEHETDEGDRDRRRRSLHHSNAHQTAKSPCVHHEETGRIEADMMPHQETGSPAAADAA